MTESAQPRYKPSLAFAFFTLGWLLHQLAYSFIPTQGVIDLVERLSVALVAIGVPLAWNEGKRGWSYLYLGFVIFQVVLGPPEPRPNTTASAIAGCIVLGMGLFGFTTNLIFLHKERNARPTAGSIPG